MIDKYALVIEHKAEGPLVWEQSLSTADYETIYKRMGEATKNPLVVRVCMVKLEYAYGNKEVLS